MKQIAWVAIRKNIEDGKEWMDLTTVSAADWWSKMLANEGGKKSVGFCKANPVDKIVRITIETMEEIA